MLKWILLLTVPFVLFFGAVAVVNAALTVDDLSACPNGPENGDPSCAKADAIIAISGGDTAARTHEAVVLYKLGWADKLILSGAAADASGPSNAAVMRQQALSAGVPDSAITLDEYSLNTAGNAEELNVISKLEGLKRIILVTSPYHQRRASLEFQRALGSRVTVLSHPTPDDKYWRPGSWWLSPQSWSIAGNELVRLIFVEVTKS